MKRTNSIFEFSHWRDLKYFLINLKGDDFFLVFCLEMVFELTLCKDDTFGFSFIFPAPTQGLGCSTLSVVTFLFFPNSLCFVLEYNLRSDQFLDLVFPFPAPTQGFRSSPLSLSSTLPKNLVLLMARLVWLLSSSCCLDLRYRTMMSMERVTNIRIKTSHGPEEPRPARRKLELSNWSRGRFLVAVEVFQLHPLAEQQVTTAPPPPGNCSLPNMIAMRSAYSLLRHSSGLRLPRWYTRPSWEVTRLQRLPLTRRLLVELSYSDGRRSEIKNNYYKVLCVYYYTTCVFLGWVTSSPHLAEQSTLETETEHIHRKQENQCCNTHVMVSL